MTRRSAANALAILLLAFSLPGSAGGANRPNIVFILADDLGWTDLACMGSQYYETPAIDRLASQGMTFMNYHNSQNCAPTRAALMTGQYAPRTGVYTVGSLARGVAANRRMDVPENVTRLPLNLKTLADQLKKAGYATGIFGKWHLGEDGPYHPSRRGFDEAIVSMGRHFDFVTTPPVDYPKGTYLADFLTDRSIDFMRRHKDGPFFLYLAHFAVHSPHQAKQELIARFTAKTAAGGHRNPTYAAMIASVDESVAGVLAELDSLKLAENTLVIFSSDNGGVGGYEELGWSGVTTNRPLRGGKGMLYEGGVRVPFIVRWPGVVKPDSRTKAMTVHVDLLPTLLEVAGAPRPDQPLDGDSMVPVLRDPAAQRIRDGVYYHFPGYLEGDRTWRTTPAGSIYSGRWKLLEFFESGKLELYDLESDLSEAQDLAGRMPEKAHELQIRLESWRRGLNAAMPTMIVPR